MMVDMSNSVGCTTLTVNSKVNYGLGVIMMCLCGFIDCNKDGTLVRDVDGGEG